MQHDTNAVNGWGVNRVIVVCHRMQLNVAGRKKLWTLLSRELFASRLEKWWKVLVHGAAWGEKLHKSSPHTQSGTISSSEATACQTEEGKTSGKQKQPKESKLNLKSNLNVICQRETVYNMVMFQVSFFSSHLLISSCFLFSSFSSQASLLDSLKAFTRTHRSVRFPLAMRERFSFTLVATWSYFKMRKRWKNPSGPHPQFLSLSLGASSSITENVKVAWDLFRSVTNRDYD